MTTPDDLAALEEQAAEALEELQHQIEQAVADHIEGHCAGRCGTPTNYLTEHRFDATEFNFTGPKELSFCYKCCPGGCDLLDEH